MIDNSYGRGKGQRAQSALARGDRSYIKITTREKPESRTWYLEQWQPSYCTPRALYRSKMLRALKKQSIHVEL